MFKNPLKKYQQGGQVSQEQQQMLAAFVEWLPKRVKEFQGMKPEQIVEALNGMTKSPEGQKQVQAYMQQFQQEMQNPQAGMFENGGKLHDFICKHAKGGHIAGCGCKEDGGKVNETQRKQQGGFLPDDVNNTMVQDTTRRNPDGSISRIRIIASPNGDAARQTITDRDTTSVGGYWDDNRFIPDGDITFNNNELEKTIQNLRNRTTVQSEQDGGNISHRDALAAAMNNYGFSKEQARRAYANAKYSLRNQGLRGHALRQAAREMISRRSQEAVENNPTLTSAVVDNIVSTARIQGPTVTTGLAGSRPVINNNYDNMSFSNAFRAASNIADKGGSKTFNWNGKTFGTKRDTNWRERWFKNTTPEVDRIVVGDDEIELPNFQPLDTTMKVEQQPFLEDKIDVPTFEQLPINTPTTQTAAQILYPGITIMQEQELPYIDPAFYGSDLMESGWQAAANRNLTVSGSNDRIVRPYQFKMINYSPETYKSAVPERKNGGVVKGQKGRVLVNGYQKTSPYTEELTDVSGTTELNHFGKDSTFLSYSPDHLLKLRRYYNGNEPVTVEGTSVVPNWRFDNVRKKYETQKNWYLEHPEFNLKQYFSEHPKELQTYLENMRKNKDSGVY